MTIHKIGLDMMKFSFYIRLSQRERLLQHHVPQRVRFQQLEAAPISLQQAVPLHFGQLIGQCAAFHIQIIGKLLAVERDREAAAPRPLRLLAKVRQQPCADGYTLFFTYMYIYKFYA